MIKDKLFFFGSTYWDPIRNGVSPSNSGTALTPTPAGLSALAAGFPGNPAVGIITNFGPYSIKNGNPGPVPGTTVNETFTNAGGQHISVPFSAIQRTIASIDNDQEDLGRRSWQATSRDRVMVRYLYQNTLAQAAFGDIPFGQRFDVPGVTHSVGADGPTSSVLIGWTSCATVSSRAKRSSRGALILTAWRVIWAIAPVPRLL